MGSDASIYIENNTFVNTNDYQGNYSFAIYLINSKAKITGNIFDNVVKGIYLYGYYLLTTIN